MQQLPLATNRGGKGAAHPDNEGIVNMRFIPSSALYILTALTAAALLLFTLLADADNAGAQTPLGGTATSTFHNRSRPPSRTSEAHDVSACRGRAANTEELSG